MRAIWNWFREGVWERDLREAGWWPRFLFGTLRAIVHVASNWERHSVGVRAGSLTVTTLLALVPMAAMVFSVARGFGFGQTLDQTLVEFSADLPAHFQDAVNKLRELVDAVDFGKLGALSSLLVMYTGMSLFVRVERAINSAWEATAKRSWLRRFSDFIAVVIIFPVLAIGAMTLSSLLASAELVDYPWLAKLYGMGLGFLPHTMLGVAFTALYKFMPNTKVFWHSAAIGGFVAGFALMFMHELYLQLQIGVAQNNRIYAALAALPLLIVYLQLAWTLVLLGAELSHSVQHASLLSAGRQIREPSPVLRERLAFATTERAVRAFAMGEGAVDASAVARELGVPRQVIESVCDDLTKASVLAPARQDGIMPVRPGAQISIADVRDAIRGEVPAELVERVALSDSLEQAVDRAEREQKSVLEAVKFQLPA